MSRRRRLVWLVGGAAGLAAVFFAALAFVIATNHLRGDVAAPESLVTEGARAGGFERVEFKTDDGLTLRADLIGDAQKRPVVLFGHGYRHRRRQGDPLARALLLRGYAVLLFDFRGSGASDGRYTGAGAIEAPDVRAAIRFLHGARGVPLERIAFVGYSMGAAAGLLAADALAALPAVVLIAPYTRLTETYEARTLRFGHLPLDPWFAPSVSILSWLLDVDVRSVRPIDAASRLARTSVLLIGAPDDWRAPVDGLREIAGCVGPTATLAVVATGGHFDLARLGDDVQALTIRFLDHHFTPRPMSR